MADAPPFAPPVRTYTDPDGRPFDYVHLTHEGSHGLGVHFSAFFGKWGDAKPYRDRFRGYFHRLKMLGTDPAHDWLFLCDAYGAHDNGTYYTGEKGDFYVERAMLAILEQVTTEHGYEPADTVMLGSSMGATAALKFGLMLDSAGILAVSPHIDLDVCALRQDRQDEVGFIVPSGDVGRSRQPPLHPPGTPAGGRPRGDASPAAAAHAVLRRRRRGPRRAGRPPPRPVAVPWGHRLPGRAAGRGAHQ